MAEVRRFMLINLSIKGFLNMVKNKGKVNTAGGPDPIRKNCILGNFLITK